MSVHCRHGDDRGDCIDHRQCWIEVRCRRCRHCPWPAYPVLVAEARGDRVCHRPDQGDSGAEGAGEGPARVVGRGRPGTLEGPMVELLTPEPPELSVIVPSETGTEVEV